MATADALLTWARSQLGVTENPPGSNHVRYWDDIGMGGYQGQPWCAAFVLAGLERVGVGPVTHSVYVPQIRADYQHAGRLLGVDQAKPGDQVLFSFGNHTDKTHTGIVESVDPAAHTVTSIDGNTSPALGGVEYNGGGVFRRTRPWSQTWGVGRPQFDPAVPPVVTTPFPGDHMRRLDMTERGLDNTGHGYTDLPSVPAGHVVSVRVNTADYAPVPQCVGDQDYGGHARLEWLGQSNAPAFAFRVWVAD